MPLYFLVILGGFLQNVIGSRAIQQLRKRRETGMLLSQRMFWEFLEDTLDRYSDPSVNVSTFFSQRFASLRLSLEQRL